MKKLKELILSWKLKLSPIKEGKKVTGHNTSHVHKWSMLSLLVLALGSSLSWNPEQLGVAIVRHEVNLSTSGEAELAATDAKAKRTDDSDDDKSSKVSKVELGENVTAEFMVDGDTVTYTIDGKKTDLEAIGLCTSSKCQSGEFVVDKKIVKNETKLLFAIKHHLRGEKKESKKYRKKKSTSDDDDEDDDDEDDEDDDDDKDVLVYDSKCEAKELEKDRDDYRRFDESGIPGLDAQFAMLDSFTDADDVRELLECQSEELKEFVKKCDEEAVRVAKDKRTEKKTKKGKRKLRVNYEDCQKLVDQYYDEEIRRPLRDGLTKWGSVGEAQKLRGYLLAKLPNRYKKRIAGDLTRITLDARREFSKKKYRETLWATNDPKAATLAAMTQMMMDPYGDSARLQYDLGRASNSALHEKGLDFDESRRLASYYGGLFNNVYAAPLTQILDRKNVVGFEAAFGNSILDTNSIYNLGYPNSVYGSNSQQYNGSAAQARQAHSANSTNNPRMGNSTGFQAPHSTTTNAGIYPVSPCANGRCAQTGAVQPWTNGVNPNMPRATPGYPAPSYTPGYSPGYQTPGYPAPGYAPGVRPGMPRVGGF